MTRSLGNILYSIWDVIWIRYAFLTSTLRSRFSLMMQGCPTGPSLRTSGNCHFKARRSGSIRLGTNVTLLAHWRTNRVGLSGRCLITTMGNGVIEIGDHLGASSVVISSRSRVTIGNYVMLGGNVRIYDHDFHSLNPKLRRSPDDCEQCLSSPVEIGDDVFVGAGVLILKGVTLGNRVIVGAGAVVASSFPDDSVIAGNPARQIVTNRPAIA
jgi:acetyltransferase-like isoleucine patch superfamily enzyme